MSFPIPENENKRLESLREFNVLDTPSEQSLDDLTFLASVICEAPIALVSLIDQDRQWFKSKVGLDVDETSRDLAFCAHAIVSDELMVVPDATADTRFAKNKLVTGDPQIRFYAGAPLVTEEGHALGTLCAIDRVPRTLTEMQKLSLEALARQVMARLELRKISMSLAGCLETIDRIK